MGLGLGLPSRVIGTVGCFFFFFFFFFFCVDIVDYELLVMVVSGVCSAVVVGLW